jgi:hypothetical protein
MQSWKTRYTVISRVLLSEFDDRTTSRSVLDIAGRVDEAVEERHLEQTITCVCVLRCVFVPTERRKREEVSPKKK